MKEKNRKLKIAVQFFGHLRTYKECAPFLQKNLLNKYDCDLFMHTWSKLNHNTQTWHNNRPDNTLTSETDIIRAYGDFKSLKIEEQHPQNLGSAYFKVTYDIPTPTKMSIFGIGALHYSMREANKLREEYEKQHEVKYDFIVCIRPDILLKTDIDMEQMLCTQSPEDINKGFFTFAKPASKVVSGLRSFTMGDVLFFAKPKVMDVFKNLPEVTSVFKPDTLYCHAPEHEFIKSVQNLGYIIYIVDYKYDEEWEILREKKRPHWTRFKARFRVALSCLRS